MDVSPSRASTICSSALVPSVTTPRAWVCPRVNSAEPCVRGSSPTSQVMGRISVMPRPSNRFCSFRIMARTSSFSRSCRITLMNDSASGYSSANCSITCSLICFSAVRRSLFSGMRTASLMPGKAISFTFSSRPSGTCDGTSSRLTTFSSPANSNCKSTNFLMVSWAKSIAANRSSSLTSLASPSTIMMDSLEPATTNSRSASSYWGMVGLMTKSPFSLATRTVAMGPSNGILEMVKAAEAPKPAKTSGSFSLSMESTVAMIWVSFRNPSGNRGRMGRSIRRADRISFSLGRPSRLIKPPGIFPAEKVFSRYSMVSGKKSRLSLGSSAATAVTSTTVSA